MITILEHVLYNNHVATMKMLTFKVKVVKMLLVKMLLGGNDARQEKGR